MNDKPVIVELVVSYPGGHETETYEIDRVEWDAMTLAERAADIDKAAEEFANNYVSWGWDIADREDYYSATQTAVDTN